MNLRFRKFKKGLSLLWLFVITAGLTGCAFKKIIYDRLDWVVMYQVDSYLDLDKAQKAKYKPFVTDAVSWLKKEKVPGAITTLEKLEDAARRKTYDQSVNNAFTAEIDSIRIALFQKYEAPIVDLLLSLNEEQIAYLAKKMSKGNEDMEDLLKEDDIAEYDEFLKRQRKTLVEYYGKLTPEQDASFMSTMRLSRTQIERRLSERKRVQAFILETLKSRNKAKVTAMIHSVRDHGEVWQDKAYLDYRQAAEKRWSDYLITFHKSLNDAQWAHLQNKLKETREDLLKMIGRL